MNQTIINVGLIGYGFGGKVFHAPLLTGIPGLKLLKVYETRPENIKDIQKKYRETRVVSNINDIFDDQDIQLVVVATPNRFHFDYAKLAMAKGKHVVVEKPFTVTSQEADELIAIAKQTNTLLTVHHNRRWDSDFKTVVKIIQSNLLGEIVEYEVHYDRFRAELKNSWKEQKSSPGAGVLYDLGSHLVDQAQYLFGLPQEIFGYLETQRRDAEVPDSFEIILKYPYHKVTLKAGMLIRETGPHFSIHGRKGSFLKFGMDVQEKELIAGKIPDDYVDWGKEPEELYGKINTEVNGIHVMGKVESEAGDYRAFYRNVYKALLGEEELAVTPQQARNTIRILELAEQSSAEKRWLTYEEEE